MIQPEEPRNCPLEATVLSLSPGLLATGSMSLGFCCKAVIGTSSCTAGNGKHPSWVMTNCFGMSNSTKCAGDQCVFRKYLYFWNVMLAALMWQLEDFWISLVVRWPPQAMQCMIVFRLALPVFGAAWFQGLWWVLYNSEEWKNWEVESTCLKVA